MLTFKPYDSDSEPRVLIIHDFAETYGGAERIAAEIAASFPASRMIALAGREEVAERMGLSGRFETLLGSGQRLLKHYRKLTPAYPLLAQMRRLPAADLLISSSYAFAHGFRTVNGAPHLSYCYSPLRFAWTMGTDYGRAMAGERAAAMVDRLAAPIRAADRRASTRVDRYVAESDYVAAQIREFYGRPSIVVHPPVDTELFRPSTEPADNYVLLCGRLIEPYKRPTMVIEAFRRMPERRLVVAGDGPEAERLRRIAPANVEFRGALGDRDLVETMARCSFAVFPSRDDFGLVPVEVMACGRPVLAYAGGGALETVPVGVGGELFETQSSDALVDAIERFEPDRYRPERIRAHAEGFGVPRFRSAIRAQAQELLDG